MKIGTNGIVVNESGQVLLIQRDDSRTFAPPGGSLEAGELPTDNVAREVREETGLIVMPVRLVGAYFSPVKPSGWLSFVFRCIQRGGEMATSSESLQVDFFWPEPLPRSMLSLHKHRVKRALSHTGGAPHWAAQRQTILFKLGSLWLKWVVYPRKDRERQREGKPKFVPASSWQITAVTLIRDRHGRVLWLKQGDSWRLPGGIGVNLEAPWETAVRHTEAQINQPVELTNLTGVYVTQDKPAMTLVFTADKPIKLNNETEYAWFLPGAEPKDVAAAQKRVVLDAASPGAETIFRQETAVLQLETSTPV